MIARPVRWVLLVAAAASLAVPGQASRAQRKMNVLFIASDDLNTRLGCYGDPQVKSPNLDRLARRGVRFDRAYCQYPLCNPSRASFLTGLRPDTTGVDDNAKDFRSRVPEAVTLPQTFRRAGYYVARVGKLFHYGVPLEIGLPGRLDDAASWQEIRTPIGVDRTNLDPIFTLTPGQYGGTLSWLATAEPDEAHTDAKGADYAIELLRQHHREPFFLAVGFYRPHTPYVAPKKYFDMYPLEKIRLPDVPADEARRHPEAALANARVEEQRMTDQQRKEAMQAYFASITFMDAQVGRVLDELQRLGLSQNTAVVFVSDHGYHLGEHGLWQKMSLFEGVARVPMIIAVPGMAANGRATGRTAELVDLHATLADVTGLPAPRLDGESLAPLLRDPAASWSSPAYTQVNRGRPAGADPGTFTGRSVRTERWRYTEWDEGRHGVELYDHERDPRELTNLAGKPEHAAAEGELKTLLRRQGARSVP